MKKIVLVLIFSFVLCGCNDYNNGDIEPISNPIDNLNDEDIIYSYGSEFTTKDNDNSCETTCKITNQGDAFTIGMLAFVNGIPQIVSDEDNGSQYIYTDSLEEDNTVQQEFTFNPISNSTESMANVRYITMIEPGVIKNNDATFYIGALQGIGGKYSAPQITNVNKYDDSIDIADISGVVTDKKIIVPLHWHVI